MVRKTKIVCTIGPVSETEEMIVKLINAGMNIARLNLSHGTKTEHKQRIKQIRNCARKLGKNVGILLDIQGPKIRLGKIEGGRVTVDAGSHISLSIDSFVGDASRVSVAYPDLTNDMNPGDTIYIDDGLVELSVVEVNERDVFCKVIVGGEIGSRKGVTLPGINVNLPPVTEEDIDHIKFGMENGIDFIAASFVRTASNVETVKQIINETGMKPVPVIAKIESDEGIKNIDEIVAIADGIMVARGDLGVEIPPEEVPLAQKMIIRKCNDKGIPVITATQMLDSMVRNPRATRAEITDVANAIFDGSDAVMLSGETAVGKYPQEAVALMNRIALKTERSINFPSMFDDRRNNRRQSIEDAISLATCQISRDLGTETILCSTQSGATARTIAKYRPSALIIAVCPDQSVVNQLLLSWGVYPILATRPNDIDELIDSAVDAAKNLDLVKSGDIVTIAAGVKTGVEGSTNLLQVYQVD